VEIGREPERSGVISRRDVEDEAGGTLDAGVA
jgi:hypothetical protein